MFEIFGPIFEQNASINFEPIFEKSVNFGPIFEKSVNFEHFVNGRWTHYQSSKCTKSNLGNSALPGFRALLAVDRPSVLNPGTTVL